MNKTLLALLLFGCAALGVALLLIPASKPAPVVQPASQPSPAPAPAPARLDAPPGRAELPNVVVISIDTLRADALGSYGAQAASTPTLDRLAREGVRFGQAYATSSWTAPSMASLMTGLYPTHHGVRRGTVVVNGQVAGQEELPHELPTLAERLKARGYRTFAVVANGHLDARFGFARGFDQYECLGFANGPRVLRTFERFAPEILGSKTPFFVWIHLFDPHSPYLAYPPYVERAWAGKPRIPELEHVTPADDYKHKDANGERLEYVRMLYASEVSYADSLAGEILERLGVLRSPSLVIALADHGEELGEHGRFGHGHNLYEETVRVPLIVRLPDGAHAGKAVDAPVSLVDVMPTIARLLALGAPDIAGDGHDLSPLWTATGAAPERVVLAELSRGHDQRMVRAGDLKLIEDRARKKVALFDLVSDPGETKDRSGSQPDAQSRLRARLSAALDGEPARESEIKPLADNEVRALKSMGYVQ